MIVVLDASVVVKLLVEDPAREPDTDEAFGIFSAIRDGKLGILQPVHWLAEVAAVAARLSPKSAVRSVAILPSGTGPGSWTRSDLAGRVAHWAARDFIRGCARQ